VSRQYEARLRDVLAAAKRCKEFQLHLRRPHDEMAIHQYFSADRELVEAVVESELPQLVQAVTEMLELQGS
jgi:uncharacterized protein with HEPN domain